MQFAKDNFFRETPPPDLEKVVLLVQGRVFLRFSSYELGIAAQMMIKAVSKFTGFLPKRLKIGSGRWEI